MKIETSVTELKIAANFKGVIRTFPYIYGVAQPPHFGPTTPILAIGNSATPRAGMEWPKHPLQPVQGWSWTLGVARSPSTQSLVDFLCLFTLFASKTLIFGINLQILVTPLRVLGYLGDFNFSHAEQYRGRPYASYSHQLSKDFVQSNRLIDLGFNGNKFTQNNH